MNTLADNPLECPFHRVKFNGYPRGEELRVCPHGDVWLICDGRWKQVPKE